MNWESFLHKASRSLAILIDPDKNRSDDDWKAVMQAVNAQRADAVLVGGSAIANDQTETILRIGHSVLDIPFVGFPGDFSHLHPKLDGLFFLSLISGRNAEYLIGQQVKAIPFLEKNKISTLPVGYVLIDGGTQTSTMQVTQTKPLAAEDVEEIVYTALAGERLGLRAIYLEAGSGAENPVPVSVVSQVASKLTVPLIVGGGIRSKATVADYHQAGANLVVVGNHFEDHLNL